MTAALSLARSLSCQMPLKSGPGDVICAAAWPTKSDPATSRSNDEREKGGGDMGDFTMMGSDGYALRTESF